MVSRKGTKIAQISNKIITANNINFGHDLSSAVFYRREKWCLQRLETEIAVC